MEVNFIDRLISRLHMAVLLVMALIRDSSNVGACCGGSPSPLRGDCPPGLADSSARMHTGRRCSLLACFEPLLRFHFSHSPLCSTIPLHSVWTDHCAGLDPPVRAHSETLSGVNSTLLAPSVSASPFGSILHHPASVSMPQLRQIMRCRRGISRGLVNSRHPSLSASSCSSFADKEHVQS